MVFAGTLLAPLVYHLVASRSSSTVVFSTLTNLNQLSPTLKARFAQLPAVMLAGAVVGMAIALAGPRTGDDHTRVRREGIAIMMVADRSGSMQARDMVKGDLSVDRLTAVKADL